MNNSKTKKELILQAAVKVFAKRGYYNSRISDIVKEAGIAHGLFYHYFPSKEEILVTIFRFAFETVLAEMDGIDQAGGNALDKLKSLIGYMFKAFRQNPESYRVLIMDVPRLGKFYEEENQKLYNRFFSRIAEFIKEGQQKDLIADSVPPLVAAHILHGSVDAVIRQYEYNPVFKQENIPFETLIDRTIDLIFRGFEK
ncbi:MAG: TetR/AcrR family transcriptional regulator [Proteobacteria bacterium]|nr:TetR/AcrR family transcriptional regulator [Pseudomonadota bacterium]